MIILCLNIYYRKQNGAILGYYAASSVNYLPTIRDNLLASP